LPSHQSSGVRSEKRMAHMKKVLAVLLPLFFATICFGDDLFVRWDRIVGVITAPGTSNPVAGIASGGFPWTTTRGRAAVNLTTGDSTFSVEGLVLVGGNASGTPGPVTSVKGTLVCNAGTGSQVVIDTPAVLLDAQGNASFSGDLASVPPSPCAN